MNKTQSENMTGEPSPKLLRFLMNLAHVLLIVLLCVWAFLLYYVGRPYDKTFVAAVFQLFGGRALGVGYGFKQGLPASFMFFQVALVDFILMLYIYPLFVRGYQHLATMPMVGSYLDNIHKAAMSHKKRMAPYGAMGLVAFVIFPFWSTGCVVGSVVGYLIGLPTWLSLSSVTIGNIAAIIAWIAFYERLTEWNEHFAHIFLLIILAVAIAGFIAARIRHFYASKRYPLSDRTAQKGDATDENNTISGQ